VITESGISTLLDAHDAIVKACADSNLSFSEFVVAYGAFPHNYGLEGRSKTAQDQIVSRLFRRRIAFHLRVRLYCLGCVQPTMRWTSPTKMPGVFFLRLGIRDCVSW
jgi:hypothetical protein